MSVRNTNNRTARQDETSDYAAQQRQQVRDIIANMGKPKRKPGRRIRVEMQS